MIRSGGGFLRDEGKAERIAPIAKAREGRPLNVSPARKGWDNNPDVDSERRRCATMRAYVMG